MKTYVATVEAVELTDGRIVTLGGAPLGLIVFEDDEPVGFQSYDNLLYVFEDDVTKIQECGIWYEKAEYFKEADFYGMHEEYEENDDNLTVIRPEIK